MPTFRIPPKVSIEAPVSDIETLAALLNRLVEEENCPTYIHAWGGYMARILEEALLQKSSYSRMRGAVDQSEAFLEDVFAHNVDPTRGEPEDIVGDDDL